MFSHRLAGVLKQYPNAEVAFYTTYVAIPRMAGAPFTCAPMIDVGDYIPGEDDDDEDDIDWVREKLYTGRDLVAYSMRQKATTIREEVANWIAAGRAPSRFWASGPDRFAVWYDDRAYDINQNTKYDALVPWIARVVNLWLKQEPPLPDLSRLNKRQMMYAFRGIPTTSKMTDHDAFLLQIEAVKDHYRHMQYLAEEISHVADWYRAEHPDIMRMSVQQVRDVSSTWYSSLREAAPQGEEPESSVAYVHGDYTFHALTAKKALEHEGYKQHHCVGSYWDMVSQGKSLIFSMRSVKDKRRATIEVSPVDNTVVQVRGATNQEVTDEKQCEAILAFFDYMHYSNPQGLCGGIQRNPAPAERTAIWWVPTPGETLVWNSLDSGEPPANVEVLEANEDTARVRLPDGSMRRVFLDDLYEASLFERNPPPEGYILIDDAPPVAKVAESRARRFGKHRVAGETYAGAWFVDTFPHQKPGRYARRLVAALEGGEIVGAGGWSSGHRGVDLWFPQRAGRGFYVQEFGELLHLETPEETAAWEAGRAAKAAEKRRASEEHHEQLLRAIEASGRPSLLKRKA